MSNLGDDVTQEILFRLSVIEIACCKAVCKAWRSLISSADFVSAHLKYSKSDPSTHFLLVHDELPLPRSRSPTKPGICCSYSVVGSVNGLICLVGVRSDSDIFIVNPVTGLSLQLPSPSTPNSDVGCKFAFWYDADVYKLAKIYFQCDGPTKLEVWDSSFPDQWTQIATTLDFRFLVMKWESGPGVLVEGVAAYWILTNRDGDAFVVWLDFKTLLIDSIPLSKRQLVISTGDWRAIRGIGESFLFGTNFKGKFALVQNSFTAGHTYRIWTMATDANGGGVGWKKTSTIYIDFPFYRCLGITANGNKLVLMSVSNGITLYDMETGVKQSEKEDAFGEHYSYSASETAHDFVGSLVWIEGFEFNDKLRALNISWPYSYTWGRVRKMQKPLLPPPPTKSSPPPPPPPPPPRPASHTYRLLHQQMQMHQLTMSMLSPPPLLQHSPTPSHMHNRKIARSVFGPPPPPPPTARISSPPPECWPPTSLPQQLTGGPHPMQFMFMHPPKSLYY